MLMIHKHHQKGSSSSSSSAWSLKLSVGKVIEPSTYAVLYRVEEGPLLSMAHMEHFSATTRLNRPRTRGALRHVVFYNPLVNSGLKVRPRISGLHKGLESDGETKCS
jgi:hypothetical protein